jgi:hypothetical protein
MWTRVPETVVVSLAHDGFTSSAKLLRNAPYRAGGCRREAEVGHAPGVAAPSHVHRAVASGHDRSPSFSQSDRPARPYVIVGRRLAGKSPD